MSLFTLSELQIQCSDSATFEEVAKKEGVRLQAGSLLRNQSLKLPVLQLLPL